MQDDGIGHMSEDIVIVGCSGHGRETLATIHAINAASATGLCWRVLGFVDDKPSAANRERIDRLDVPYLGPIEWLGEVPSETYVVLGIGDPKVRKGVDQRIKEYGLKAASLVHPAATLCADTVAGEGLLVFAGARVTTNVTLGRHVHLNQNVAIGHDCILEDFVSVNPLATISGECHIETGVLIGCSATLLQGLRVGANTIVGASACVVHDVRAGVVVKGVPAR
jgi:sugar O-acyltransferase (sialic acid O-acetyltransferase NeuD family)